MQLLPNAKSQFIDANGLPLAGGSVGFYSPGTLNPKTTYQDQGGTIANTNPVLLDSRGQALIWGSGVYRQIVKDSTGVTIWDQITEDPSAGLTGNMTDARWVVGASYTDPVGNTPGTFVPGTTTTFNLPVAAGSIANTWLFFDLGYQTDDQVQSISGTTFTLASPVPNGIQEVTIKIGTTVAVGTPSNGTVTDASVAPGSLLYNRVYGLRSVKDFGAKGDGVTDDTAAIQSAITNVVNTGGSLYFPDGRYLSSGVTIDGRNGGQILGNGQGASMIVAKSANSILFNLTNQQINTPNLKPFLFDGIGFDGNSQTAPVGIQAIDFALLTLNDIYVNYMAYVIKATATTTGPLGFATNLTISNVTQYGWGSYYISSGGTGATGNRCFNINISNIQQYSAGVHGWTDNWFTFNRCVNVNVSNVVCEALEGQVQALYCTGASEGLFFSNVIAVYGTTLVTCSVGADTIAPKWIYFSNCGFDQPTVSGMDINASYLRMTNVNVTGGALRSNTGNGVTIRGATVDYTLVGLQVANMKSDGLAILSGATRGKIVGGDFELNAQGGSGWDVDIVAATPVDPMFSGGSYIGTLNTSGTAVLNAGNTSRFANTQRNQVGTPADTAAHTLASYAIPAGSASGTSCLEIVASGTFSADANTKTVVLYVDGASLATLSGAYNGLSWRIKCRLLRNGGNTWSDVETVVGASQNFSSANVVGLDINAAHTYSLQAQNGAAVANDILMNHFDVELVL